LNVSYALLFVYDQLIRSFGPITVRDLETLKERLMMAGDIRDALTARDSVRQLLGAQLLDT
jgi:hypothetical protein